MQLLIPEHYVTNMCFPQLFISFHFHLFILFINSLGQDTSMEYVYSKFTHVKTYLKLHT